MSAKDYLPLLVDGRTMIRTLRQTYGKARLPDTPHYAPGQVSAATDLFHPDRVEVRVSAVRRETPSAVTLVLEPVEGRLPPAHPGQYVNVFVEIDGVRTSRPMSISSVGRTGERMELTIKKRALGFVSVHLVDNVRPGDQLTLSGPEGDFFYTPVRDGRDLVFIAGGSGITPFMGMIEEILARRPDVHVLLLYGSPSPGEVIFRGRLEALAADPRFGLHLVVERPDAGWTGEAGRVDLEMLRHAVVGGATGDKTFFICGPPAMERAVLAALEVLGVDESRIRIEPSGSGGDPTQLSGWPVGLDPRRTFQVEVEGRDEPVGALAGEPLVTALERAGIDIPVLCRSGSCGSCRTRLRSGQVARSDEPGARPSDQASGYIHACVSHPVSDLVVQTSGALLDPGRLPPLPATPGSPPGSENARRPPWVQVGLATAGLGLFVYLVMSSGITPEILAGVGWAGFGLVLLLSFLNILGDTLAWSLTLRHVARPGLPRLLFARIGGDALTNGLPGGLVVGESYKAVMLRRWFGISLTDGAASQLTIKFGLGISQSLFVLTGLILVYPLLRDRSAELLGFDGAQHIGVLVIVGFQLVLTMLLLAVFRGRSFGALAGGLARLPMAPLRRWLAANRGRIDQVDQSCARVLSDNGRSLIPVFVLLLLGWLLGALESYVLLRALGQPVSLQTAFTIESVGSMFRLLFFLVPSGIGGQDASLLALFKLFRLPTAAGGAFVLIKRFKELLWIGVGFVLILASRQRPGSAAEAGPLLDRGTVEAEGAPAPSRCPV